MSAEIIAFRKRDKPKSKSAPVPVSRRLEALDTLRGVCVVAMIVAVGFGRSLDGAGGPWHGLALQDLIFPGFLLCLGMAIPLSFAGRAARQGRGELMLHVAVRTLALLALGLFLNLLPDFDLAHVRLPGDLQRAALCYAATAVFCFGFGRKSDADFTLPSAWAWAAAGVVLAGYAAALLFWQSPECAGGCFDAVRSLPGAADRMVFGTVGADPMGLVSTLGALGVSLIGVAAGLYVRQSGIRTAAAGLALAGILLFVAGACLDPHLPVIAGLTTPSFALVAAGAALLVFALAALIGEIPWLKHAAYPLRVFGANALPAVVAVILADRFGMLTVAMHWLPDPSLAAPICIFALLLVIGLPLWGLYHRRIFLKL